MTISIWRYSHLALAISSFLILALAALTGIILAFEPITQKLQPYKAKDFDSITVAKLIPKVKANFDEITSITVDHHGFVTVKGLDVELNDVNVYIDPNTGKTIGVPAKQHQFFEWVTGLHRSLFLHELGRFFVGLTSFLLFLITISGTALILQRQRGLKHFFKKIVRENFAQYYHVTLGRLLLIPVLLIALTGTYLSMVRFKLFETPVKTAQVDLDALKSSPKKSFADFAIFKDTPLSEVRSIEFPFSEDVEDYFTIKLKDREITVNQLTGEVLTTTVYPTTVLLTALSLDLHTGRTSMWWAIVLAFASGNILFFIYSGFAITLKRISGLTKNKFKKEECNYIILVGSENGTTFRFAKAVHQQLISNGEKSYLTALNQYTVFPKATHFIVFTATYGLGDPPTNASKFLLLLEKQPQLRPIDFSVVGFGSTSYPDFCKYAFEVNNALTMQDWAVPVLEIHTVNDKSPADFNHWAAQWSQKVMVPIRIAEDELSRKIKKSNQFTVVRKTEIAHPDGSFLLELKPKRKLLSFTSGDLLAIYPRNDHRERLYSIGKVNKNIQLSVKLHPNGLGSSYLYQLEPGQIIAGNIEANSNFHFPRKTSMVIMIANGTGIAPFLGMLDANEEKVFCHLYCGFREEASFELYKEVMKVNLEEKKLTALNVAYSREGNKQYVNELIARDRSFIAQAVEKGAVVMICGSLAMQKDVFQILDTVFNEINGQTLSYYQSHNQILMDCY
jgi:sulfite reductase (NADPH) flavoprotein alpha-component